MAFAKLLRLHIALGHIRHPRNFATVRAVHGFGAYVIRANAIFHPTTIRSDIPTCLFGAVLRFHHRATVPVEWTGGLHGFASSLHWAAIRAIGATARLGFRGAVGRTIGPRLLSVNAIRLAHPLR